MKSNEFEDQTKQYFFELIDHLYSNGGDFEKCRNDALAAAERAGIPEYEMKEHMVVKWTERALDALSDGVLTNTEEDNLAGILSAFGLDSFGAIDGDLIRRMTKLAIIRDLKDGKVESRIPLKVTVPFKMQKSETLLWRAENVTLKEVVKKRQIKGQSLGFSFRVAKGVYVRPSAFSAATEETESLQVTDRGDVFLTNKHLYFNGGDKNFRIRLTAFATIEPYSDGLELQKNTQTARPFFLLGLDGWFFYNVIQAV